MTTAESWDHSVCCAPREPVNWAVAWPIVSQLRQKGWAEWANYTRTNIDDTIRGHRDAILSEMGRRADCALMWSFVSRAN